MRPSRPQPSTNDTIKLDLPPIEFHIFLHDAGTDKLLAEMNDKLDKIQRTLGDLSKLAKAVETLKGPTDELKSAIDENQPTPTPQKENQE